MSQEVMFFVVGVITTMAGQLLLSVFDHMLILRRAKLERDTGARGAKSTLIQIADVGDIEQELREQAGLTAPIKGGTFAFATLFLLLLSRYYGQELLFAATGVAIGLLIIWSSRFVKYRAD